VPISCLPISLFEELSNGIISIGEWAARGKSMGLDGIDISMTFVKNHTPAYIRRVKRELHDAGIPVIMATTYPDFTHPDELQRMRERSYLARDIAVCSALQIKYLRVLAGQAHPGIGREDGIRYAVEGLLASVPAANRYGITLVFEDHAKPSAWDYVDFSHPTDIFLDIAGQLRGSGIGINFDTGNITAYGDNPLDVLPKIADMIRTVHVSDMAEKGRFLPVVIGEGVTPNFEIFRFLKRHGFQGWLCIEEASGNGWDGISRSICNTKKLWNDA